MQNRFLPLALAAAVVLVFGAAVAVAVEKPADNVTGTFVSFADGKLTFTDDKGKDQAVTLAKDVKINIDGAPAKMDDLKTLKKGVTVTLNDKTNPTQIDVKTK
jgi:hypothetical protein